MAVDRRRVWKLIKMFLVKTGNAADLRRYSLFYRFPIFCFFFEIPFVQCRNRLLLYCGYYRND